MIDLNTAFPPIYIPNTTITHHKNNVYVTEDKINTITDEFITYSKTGQVVKETTSTIDYTV